MILAAARNRDRNRVLHEPRDAVLVVLAMAHAAALFLVPHAAVVALGVWWSSNTVSHCFIHRPFFRARGLNAAFDLFLSALLGIPQAVWKARHLAHHAGVPPRLRWSALLGLELLGIAAAWSALVAASPAFFLAGYLPGLAAGLVLCWLHGRGEHARGTVSHHGRLYNLLFLNDGYHVEHHERPGTHWSKLPALARDGTATSRWPPVLRWIEGAPLELLEKIACRFRPVRRFVLDRHRRALRRLLDGCAVRRAAIVGGGLFPRTAIILRELLPEARLTVIDGNPASLERARRFLPEGIETREEWFVPGDRHDFDLVVFPLSYRGDRRRVYERPPAPLVLVHDWIWSRRGRSAAVSVLLLKRLNLVTA